MSTPRVTKLPTSGRWYVGPVRRFGDSNASMLASSDEETLTRVRCRLGNGGRERTQALEFEASHAGVPENARRRDRAKMQALALALALTLALALALALQMKAKGRMHHVQRRGPPQTRANEQGYGPWVEIADGWAIAPSGEVLEQLREQTRQAL